MAIIKNYFTKSEIILWSSSVIVIMFAFCVFDRHNYLTLTASIIGVTSLIFNAKGNPIGQALMIVFSLLYGIISYTFAYYGEMITYIGMTMPMAVFALVSWLRNPYNGDKVEVKVNNTSNLILSTISVTTSFVAVYLTYRRSPFFAVAYAANDIYGYINWQKMKKRQEACSYV